MKAVQLKIILKKSKPPFWRRVIIPLGITFTQLAYILDLVMEDDLNENYFFEFYNEGIRLIEKTASFPDYYLYTKHAANETFVREYCERAKWFTFEPNMILNKAYRVEIESLGELYSNHPQCVKGYFDKQDDFHRINLLLQEKCSYVFNEATYPLFNEIDGVIYATKKDKNKIMRTRQDVQKETQKIISRIKKANTTGPSLKKETPKTLNLKDILKQFDEKSINEMCQERKLGIAAKSYQEKVDQLVTYMLHPKVMLDNFMILSNQEIHAFEDLYNKKIINDHHLARLTDLSYVGYTEDGLYDVPDDVWKIYQNLHIEYYEEKRTMMNYIVRCVETALYLYLCCPIEQLLKFVNLKYSMTINELMDFLHDIPSEVFDLCIGDMIYLTILEEDDTKEMLLSLQGNKPFYTPTYDEIISFSDTYSWKTEKLEMLSTYLKQLGMTSQCASECLDYVGGGMTRGLTIEDGLSFIIDRMMDKKLSMVEIVKLNELLMKLQQHTRMIIHRGHTPIEIHNLNFS